MELFVRRVREVGLMLDPARAERVWVYFQLLAKWNVRVNLTGLRVASDSIEAIDRLLIEPIRAAEYADAAQRMLDIGSGGGSPAIPFALAARSIPRLTMIESKERKSVFLREALRETGLAGEVKTVRFEEFAAPNGIDAEFDLATVRAVRVDSGFLERVAAVLSPGGRLFCFHERGKDFSADANFRWDHPRKLLSESSYLSIAAKQ